ncbi:MAG TPA: glycoside hydrolase family 127 protein [Bacteroidetes bacterium]|nr:glycoside hydrolase family 127 protein [Bacteroidota bacterium]
MKNLKILFVLIVFTGITLISCNKKEQLKDYPIKPVELKSVKMTDKFWYPKIKTNHDVTIKTCINKLYSDGRIKNFKIAGGLERGHYQTNQPFNGPTYKVLEGVAYSIQTFPEDTLVEWMDTIIYYLSKAQEDDGYLYPARTIMGDSVFPHCGKKRWERLEEGSHELFNHGHMMEAAVAHYQATGKDNFLKIAKKAANMIYNTFGYGKLEKYPGHQEIELALVRMFRETNDQRYLDLAKFFLDVRGPDGAKNIQAHKKVVDQRRAVGHAVRAVYMYSAMTDVAALTNDISYIEAIKKIWEDIITGKFYITGGIGSSSRNEGFEEPYILPNMHSYCETCASIGNVYWNHRMFLYEGNAKYYDILERTLYNALLSGVSLRGNKFFYSNMLESHGQYERSPWFNVACCPTSMCRFIPSFPRYIYAQSKDRLFVNIYAASEATLTMDGQLIKIIQDSNYPWDGNIMITLEPEESRKFSLSMRIPNWARGKVVPSDLYTFKNESYPEISASVNGKSVSVDIEEGYLTITRTWEKGDQINLDIPMPIQIIQANENIVFDRNKVAIQKGPIVYCAEWPDNPGGKVLNLILDYKKKMTTEFREDLLGGVNVIHAKGYSTSRTLEGDTTISDIHNITLIPYYVWANRGPGEMRVWLATDKKGTIPAPAPTIAARSKVTASVESPTLFALNDQVYPENSILREIPGLYFSSNQKKTAWIQYNFDKTEKVKKIKTYWLNKNNFTIPESWDIQYINGTTWSSVDQKDTIHNQEDTYLEIDFTPIETNTLRFNFDMNDSDRMGILEWIVE